VLLASGQLTFYQLSLIEAGNLDALVLGPVRVVDRLPQVTPRETLYRVFDPRRASEAGGGTLLLRHLAEDEAVDPIRPDEYRQRFAAAAAVSHPNVASVVEVLDIAGRPAALQEWVAGLASGDWPALAGVPGVWFRLVNQAALGLATLHRAGIVHGSLHAGSVVLTADGTVKLCGAGEPPWLLAEEPAGPATATGDLRALGRLAADWAERASRRKGGVRKPLPDSLQAILRRLRASENDAEAGPAFTTADELLAELEQAGADVPGNAEAWSRLLAYAAENAADGPIWWRQSA
jgi:hypothetical protein